jgi:hypothetical protein
MPRKLPHIKGSLKQSQEFGVLLKLLAENL